jgi:hypothetical protein
VPAEFLSLPASRGDTTRLEAVLAADSRLGRARSRRAGLTQLLALLGVPLWLIAAWPSRLSGDLRALVLASFAAGAAAMLAAVGQEWHWARARTRRVAALGHPAPRTCAGTGNEES